MEGATNPNFDITIDIHWQLHSVSHPTHSQPWSRCDINLSFEHHVNQITRTAFFHLKNISHFHPYTCPSGTSQASCNTLDLIHPPTSQTCSTTTLPPLHWGQLTLTSKQDQAPDLGQQSISIADKLLLKIHFFRTADLQVGGRPLYPSATAALLYLLRLFYSLHIFLGCRFPFR